MASSSTSLPRIFVSHSHVDNEFGIKLVRQLRLTLGEESSVWYDVAGGLHGGDSWWNKIIEELEARDVFIIILSPDAMKSYWVVHEIDVALNERKRIIPLLLRPCKPRADLKILQMISFEPPKSFNDAFRELQEALGLPSSLAAQQLQSTPTNADAVLVQKLIPQIKAAFAEQDWPDVIRKAKFVIKQAPGLITAEIYHMQAVALHQEGEARRAKEAFDTALALVGDRNQRLTILNDYTSVLIEQEQWDEVQRVAKEALRLMPNDPQWLATQNVATQRQVPPTRRFDANEQVHVGPSIRPGQQKPIPSYQKSKAHWLEEGNGYYGVRDYEKAVQAYTMALQLDAKYARAYANRGDAYRMLGDNQHALQDINQAIMLDSNNPLPYANRGDIYRLQKDFRHAIQDLNRAIVLDANYVRAYAWRGETHRQMHNYEQALQDFNTAITLDPSYAWAYTCRGQVYSSLGRYSEAVEDFDRALLLDPTMTWTYSSDTPQQ